MTNRQVESFKITHSHGITEIGIETYDEAVDRVRAVYGAECEIGHSGDCEDGGNKTLCWQDTETAENDDGSRACCAIHKVYEDEVYEDCLT